MFEFLKKLFCFKLGARTANPAGFNKDGNISSPVEKQSGTIGSNILSNGSFDNWDSGLPVDWSSLPVGSGTITEETSVVYTAGKSVKMTVGSSGGRAAIYQTKTGLTVGSEYRLDFWGYVPNTNSGDTTVGVLVLNGVFGVDATHYWDFETSSWVEIIGGDPGPGIQDYITSPNTWTSFYAVVGKDITVPASGKLSIVFVIEGSTPTENDVIYIDESSLKAKVDAAAVSLFDFSNPSNAFLLNSQDTVFKFQTTGGTAKNHFSMDGSGAFNTDHDSFNFTSKKLLVANSTDAQSAVNKINSKALLGSATINLVNSIVVSFNFTLPSGYKIINPELLVEVTSANNLTGDYTISIGTNNPDYNNIINGLQPVVTSVGQRLFNASGSTLEVCSTAGEIFVKSTADSGTSGSAKLYLYGTLI